MQNEPNVVIIGGGTGCATLFPEVARATPNATAILAMSDDGGSTGRLVHQLGLMPMGDLRNVMLAASEDKTVQALAAHRFGGRGNLHGHHWGNMLLAAYFEQLGVAEGTQRASELLRVRGTVLPATLEPNELIMRDGCYTIRGEHRIDTHRVHTKEPLLSLNPTAALNPRARQAIAAADLIVISPGSIFTSILAALAVDGMREELVGAHAPKVLVTNLMTERHHTDGWHVADYVTCLERHGIDIDVALYNTEIPDGTLLDAYLAEGQQPVDISGENFEQMAGVRAVGLPLLGAVSFASDPNDSVQRSFVRHNAAAVREALWRVLPDVIRKS